MLPTQGLGTGGQMATYGYGGVLFEEFISGDDAPSLAWTLEPEKVRMVLNLKGALQMRRRAHLGMKGALREGHSAKLRLKGSLREVHTKDLFIKGNRRIDDALLLALIDDEGVNT